MLCNYYYFFCNFFIESDAKTTQLVNFSQNKLNDIFILKDSTEGN